MLFYFSTSLDRCWYSPPQKNCQTADADSNLTDNFVKISFNSSQLIISSWRNNQFFPCLYPEMLFAVLWLFLSSE